MSSHYLGDARINEIGDFIDAPHWSDNISSNTTEALHQVVNQIRFDKWLVALHIHNDLRVYLIYH